MMVTLKAEEYKVFRNKLVALIEEQGDLSSIEILAVAANMVGNIIALQDARFVTSEMAMDVVLKNIEHGNASAIENALGTTAGSA